jgi:phosphoglycerol transferase MdoB-like AlkP superfamily enzyme
MTQYFMNDTGTLQNDYTGLFKGKNLIYIMAESFNGLAVSEELTPTLYKMIHDGFDFTEFYNPTIASTIGGETQLLTGLYPAAYGPMQNNPAEFKMGLANIFKEVGYDTFAYHDWSYTFQGRNKYLAKMGFTNFKGCRNGLENIMNCKWLPSDIEMVEATAPEYINSENPFVVFYATVSGHGGWSFSSNKIAQKYKTEVQAKYPDYPADLQAYIASQLELDRALEKLVDLLEEAGKLDDTVIVLGGDHYPYMLSEDDTVKNYFTKTMGKDLIVGINYSNCIIWNNKVEHKEVSKTMSTIDILPTVYNLFGLKYDSRLIIGKDVFAPGDGLAMFNSSWVTDKGIYYSATRKFVANEGVVLDDEEAYIKEMNAIIKDKKNVSGNLVRKDYYAKAWKYLN